MEDKEFKLLCGSILFVMVCFGTVGNIVSAVTWRRGKRCKTFPGALYLTALAISDTLVLCTAGAKYAIELIFQINLWDLNEVFCKLFHTTWHFFFLVSTWIVVSLTVERTLAVCQPLKSASRKSRKREFIVICILSLLFLLTNLPFTFGARLIPTAKTSSMELNNMTNTTSIVSGDKGGKNITVAAEIICQAEPGSFYYKYENAFHNWFIDFGLLFSVPVGVLTLCNIVMLVTLCRRNRSIIMNLQQSQKHRTEMVPGSMTARVVALSLVQCISVGPFSVAALIPGVLPEIKAVDTVKFIDRLLIVLVLIWYLNNCVNFILYSLFGKTFRQDCADILKKIRPASSRLRQQDTTSPQLALTDSSLTFDPLIA